MNRQVVTPRLQARNHLILLRKELIHALDQLLLDLRRRPWVVTRHEDLGRTTALARALLRGKWDRGLGPLAILATVTVALDLDVPVLGRRRNTLHVQAVVAVRVDGARCAAEAAEQLRVGDGGDEVEGELLDFLHGGTFTRWLSRVLAVGGP
jgi:hypothetical protein